MLMQWSFHMSRLKVVLFRLFRLSEHVQRLHSGTHNCTVDSKEGSLSKFSLRYQCIVKQRGDENIENRQLRE